MALPPRPVAAHCQPCHTTTRFRFSSWASDGAEAAKGKPRAFHRSCTACSHVVLTLADLHDSYGLCASIAAGRVKHEQQGKVERDDAIGYLFWHAWRLYLAWRPDTALTSLKRVTPSFLGYASYWLPRRLDAYIGEATGEATARRRHPRADAHAASLTAWTEFNTDGGTYFGDGEGPPAALIVQPHDVGLDERGLVVALGGDAQDAADDRQGDLGWLLGVGDRGGAGRAAA